MSSTKTRPNEADSPVRFDDVLRRMLNTAPMPVTTKKVEKRATKARMDKAKTPA